MISGLFSLKMWFNTRPDALLPVYQLVLNVFVIALLVLYVVTLLIRKRTEKSIYRKFWLKINNFLISNFIIGVFVWFFSFELIPFLSARFWLLLWGLIMLTWLVFIAKEVKVIPKKRVELEKQREFQKYIP